MTHPYFEGGLAALYHDLADRAPAEPVDDEPVTLRMAALLNGVAEALKGPVEPGEEPHGWTDLPDLAAHYRGRDERAQKLSTASLDLRLSAAFDAGVKEGQRAERRRWQEALGVRATAVDDDAPGGAQ